MDPLRSIRVGQLHRRHRFRHALTCRPAGGRIASGVFFAASRESAPADVDREGHGPGDDSRCRSKPIATGLALDGETSIRPGQAAEKPQGVPRCEGRHSELPNRCVLVPLLERSNASMALIICHFKMQKRVYDPRVFYSLRSNLFLFLSMFGCVW